MVAAALVVAFDSVTDVAWSRPDPSMVTLVPCGPLAGLIPPIDGGLKVKLPLLLMPSRLVTTTATGAVVYDVAPMKGTSTASTVGLSATIVAETPPKVTELAWSRSDPVMTTWSPTLPVGGLTLVIDGAA